MMSLFLLFLNIWVFVIWLTTPETPHILGYIVVAEMLTVVTIMRLVDET